MPRVRHHYPPINENTLRNWTETPTYRDDDTIFYMRTNNDFGHFDGTLDIENLSFKLDFTLFENGKFGEKQTVYEVTYANREEMLKSWSYTPSLDTWRIRDMLPGFDRKLANKALESRPAIELPDNHAAPIRKMRKGRMYEIYTHVSEMKCNEIRANHQHAFQIWIKDAKTKETVYNTLVECKDMTTAKEKLDDILINFDLVLMESLLA